MSNLDRVITELARKNVPFFVKTDYENNAPVGRSLSKITITTKLGAVGQRLYYANGKLISARIFKRLVSLSHI